MTELNEKLENQTENQTENRSELNKKLEMRIENSKQIVKITKKDFKGLRKLSKAINSCTAMYYSYTNRLNSLQRFTKRFKFLYSDKTNETILEIYNNESIKNKEFNERYISIMKTNPNASDIFLIYNLIEEIRLEKKKIQRMVFKATFGKYNSELLLISYEDAMTLLDGDISFSEFKNNYEDNKIKK